MADDKPEAGARTVNIKIDEDKAAGEYANVFLCNFTPTEFVLDAVVLMPGLPNGKLLHRTILSPANAKRLAMMLTEQVKQYEKNLGPLTAPAGPKVSTSMN